MIFLWHFHNLALRLFPPIKTPMPSAHILVHLGDHGGPAVTMKLDMCNEAGRALISYILWHRYLRALYPLSPVPPEDFSFYCLQRFRSLAARLHSRARLFAETGARCVSVVHHHCHCLRDAARLWIRRRLPALCWGLGEVGRCHQLARKLCQILSLAGAESSQAEDHAGTADLSFASAFNVAAADDRLGRGLHCYGQLRYGTGQVRVSAHVLRRNLSRSEPRCRACPRTMSFRPRIRTRLFSLASFRLTLMWCICTL